MNEPTRIAENSRTLIDPVVVSDTCDTSDSGVFPVDRLVSDHRATYVSVTIKLSMSNDYYREVWNYKNADFTALNNLVQLRLRHN